MTDSRSSAADIGRRDRGDDGSASRVVMKFGGTSVRDVDAVRRLCQIVQRDPRRRLIVVSALSGVTDQLIELATQATAGKSPTLTSAIEALRTRHVDLATSLVTGAEQRAVVQAIDNLCGKLGAMVHAVAVLRELSRRSADAITGIGEAMSSRLIAAALDASAVATGWIDARQVLVTDSAHGRAQPDMHATTARVRDLLEPLLDGGATVVMGGFVGATAEGVGTTLGRGGSDYSAAIFGAILDAEEIQIWTDVDGMLTADPRIVTGAHLVPALTFGEASELAYFGAKVLHPATIQPAIARGIPVRIVNAQRPDGHGTEITAQRESAGSTIAALASKGGLTVIEITSARMLMAHGFLKRLFEVFDRFETAVDVVTTSEVNVSVTIDDATRLTPLVAQLSTFAEVSTEPDMALLCVVGERLHDDPGLFAETVGALGDISCRMVSESASRRNLTFVLHERELPFAMTRLHDHFFTGVEA